ncbi:hypothetical protein JMJ55_20370 [Belnapia sp. T6]|uniref:Uncharacterized protein n=1 Tax=Belnapia mucosa TaxID=2804532 RepID=A0ABS1V7Q5_9PROT|nr:hypothetical protein [Belnapia mucosa]MBL6457695.1 hypothetical protein [Belnapia mucosa]
MTAPNDAGSARDVTDADGVTWSCIQAFADLGKDAANAEAARVAGAPDRFHVVRTPSGGARSVRIALPGGWEQAASEKDILAAIDKARGEGQGKDSRNG